MNLSSSVSVGIYFASDDVGFVTSSRYLCGFSRTLHFSALYFLFSQTCVFFLAFLRTLHVLVFHILNGWAGESTAGMVFALEMEQWFNIISIISCDP